MTLFSVLSDPHGTAKQFVTKLGSVQSCLTAHVSNSKQPSVKFVLCLAGTQTSDLPGISAAGETPQARRLTPAIDAEILVSGKCISAPGLPVSPAGIVSPVVITRACLTLLGCPVKVYDCGSFVAPAIDHYKTCGKPALLLSSGAAQELKTVRELFEEGIAQGKQEARNQNYFVIAECVPGGTSTALAVLTGMGIQARGLVSSSLPSANDETRWLLVEKGLEALAREKHKTKHLEIDEHLRIVAAVGDPMQPFAAGLAIGARQAGSTVILAGGSQMIAVGFLSEKLNQEEELRPPPLVVTTRWVASDAISPVARLSHLTEIPLIAGAPDLSRSQHIGLQAYEEGHVKEGVGAGASMALLHLIKGMSESDIVSTIDSEYSRLVIPDLELQKMELQKKSKLLPKFVAS